MALDRLPDYQTCLSQLTFRFKRNSILIFKIALLVQEKKIQIRFSKWLLGRPSWISDQNDFSYF